VIVYKVSGDTYHGGVIRACSFTSRRKR